MNIIDIVLGIILVLAFFSGLKRGFLQSLASLIGLIVGVYAALYFSDFVGNYLSDWFDWSEQTTKWSAFAITFLGVLFLANFVGKLLTKIANFVLLGFLNKLLGGVFAVLKYAFIMSLFFLFFSSNNFTGYLVPEEKKEGSILYGYIAPIAPSILPSIIDEFNTLRKPKEESTTEIPERTQDSIP